MNSVPAPGLHFIFLSLFLLSQNEDNPSGLVKSNDNKVWKYIWKYLVTSRCYRAVIQLMDYTAHGILQAIILEWVAISFSRGSFQPWDQTQVSCIVGGFFTSWSTREAQEYWSGLPCPPPGELPDPGIKPRYPALQANSLPSEVP